MAQERRWARRRAGPAVAAATPVPARHQGPVLGLVEHLAERSDVVATGEATAKFVGTGVDRRGRVQVTGAAGQGHASGPKEEGVVEATAELDGAGAGHGQRPLIRPRGRCS